tara:strand:- start:13192 stop:14142 length:951 start_codon:yes stop_codon:yes gene_type:complete
MNLIVVIVNYGTPIHVLKNLNALVPELRKLGPDAKCWIVDNCSPDDSLSIISNAIEQENYQDCVSLIPHPINGGFGAGNNVAIKKALELEIQPDLIYLLNPDAIILPGTLAKMTTYFDDNKNIGIVGGPTLDLNGNVECGAFRFHSLRSTIEENLSIGFVSKLWRKHRVTISPPPDTASSVGWVSGANMMIRREALEKAGLFDEKFFLYFEEVDLCRRITESGFEIHYLPEAKIIHDAGASTGINTTAIRLPKYWHNSRSLYLKKAFGSRGLLLHNLATLIAGSIGHIYRLLRGRPSKRKKFLRDIIKYNFGEDPK